MSIKSRIIDGTGRCHGAKVGVDNQLHVACVPPELPLVGTASRYHFFSGYLTDDGLTTGTTNMNVDGSTTAVEYWLPADKDGTCDIHIMGIVVVVADTAVTHKKFGNEAALTIGWDLWTWEEDHKTYILEKAKTGASLIWQSGFHNPFSTGATFMELNDFNAADDDAQLVYIPMDRYIPGGLRLGIGTNDKIAATVNDNLEGLTEMYVWCLGYKHN